MDEFEIFKARASGCEIQLEDSLEIFQRSTPRESLRSEGLPEEIRRSSRRKSLRKNSRRLPEKENDGSLQVKVEIQPPSPVACRRLSENRRDSDEQSLNLFKFPSNGSTIHSVDAESNFTEDAFKSSPQVDARRRKSRHSFTESCHGNDVLPSDEFRRDSSDKDEDQKFQRSKSCRNTSFNDKRRISNLIQEHSSRRPSQVQNDDSNGCQDNEHDSVESTPTVYRVRSFTTKKGEIISRGDSFKICGSGNRQFLLVAGDQRSACQRRCSAAVAGGSYSRLEVCSLSPGNNSIRRSSLTCLAVNQSTNNQLQPITRRGSSESRRLSSSKIDVIMDEQRKSSLTSGRESLPQELASQQEAVEGWSNKSNDAENVQCCVTEEFHAPPPQVYHVTVLGSSGVGKSTLVNQLMTSEYLANKEQNDQGEDETERLVSVVLDGIESTVHFHEGLCTDEDIQNDAYLLIFSVTERNSLTFIQSCLHDILKNDKRFHHQISSQRKVPLRLRFHRQKPSAGGSPVISDVNSSHDKHHQLEEEDVEPPKPVLYLVGNKQDLVRNRVVSEADVKRLMEVKKNRCKYTEVSALLDHKVDEVLVDIVREIRTRASRAEQEDSDVEDVSRRGCLQQAMVGFCGKLFK